MRTATLAAPAPTLSSVASQQYKRVSPVVSKTNHAARVGSARLTRHTVKAQAQSIGAEGASSRREALIAAAALATTVSNFGVAPAAQAGNIPGGFTGYSDSLKNYAFLYPFGWQEVSVDGVDVVFKDSIEALESVSLTIIPTKSEMLSDLGTADEVAKTLVNNILTAPSANPQILNATSREVEGKTYYQVEFTAKYGSSIIRHQFATVGLAGGKFFVLTTGCNERRWGKMQKKLEIIAKSFYNIY